MSTATTTQPCLIEHARDAFNLFTKRLSSLKHEQAWLLTLRRDHRVIQEHLIGEGDQESVKFAPRKLLRIALLDDAEAIILIHNHPDGDLAPSLKDIAATAQIRSGCRAIGIRLLDAIIIAGSSYYSFDHEGSIKAP
jgi:DNA repair protein RadC